MIANAIGPQNTVGAMGIVPRIAAAAVSRTQAGLDDRYRPSILWTGEDVAERTGLAVPVEPVRAIGGGCRGSHAELVIGAGNTLDIRGKMRACSGQRARA